MSALCHLSLSASLSFLSLSPYPPPLPVSLTLDSRLFLPLALHLSALCRHLKSCGSSPLTFCSSPSLPPSSQFCFIGIACSLPRTFQNPLQLISVHPIEVNRHLAPPASNSFWTGWQRDEIMMPSESPVSSAVTLFASFT